MILIAIACTANEARLGAGGKAKENFLETTPFQSKGNALLIQIVHCKKGTFALLLKKEGSRPPGTPSFAPDIR